MAFTYLWTPGTVKPQSDSEITIRTADENKTVPGATISASTQQISFTVPNQGRYRLRVRTGSQAEELITSIPVSSPLPNLYDRLNTLEGRKVADAQHTHVVGDVTNLQASLDAKQNTLQDTGWRSMPLPAGIGGTVLMRRFGPNVHVNLIGVTAGTAGDQLLAATPAGFRGTAQTASPNTTIGRILSGTNDSNLTYNSTSVGILGIGVAATTATTTVAYTGSGMYFTTDAFPTTLPGTAV